MPDAPLFPGAHGLRHEPSVAQNADLMTLAAAGKAIVSCTVAVLLMRALHPLPVPVEA